MILVGPLFHGGYHGDNMGIFMGYSSNRGRWVCRNFNLLILERKEWGAWWRTFGFWVPHPCFNKGNRFFFSEPALGIAKKIPICYLDRMVNFSFQYLGETTGILIGEVCPKVAWFTKPKKVSWNGHKLGYTPYSWTNLSDPIRVSPSVLPKHRSVPRFKDQSIVNREIQILDTSRWSNPAGSPKVSSSSPMGSSIYWDI